MPAREPTLAPEEPRFAPDGRREGHPRVRADARVVLHVRALRERRDHELVGEREQTVDEGQGAAGED